MLPRALSNSFRCTNVFNNCRHCFSRFSMGLPAACVLFTFVSATLCAQAQFDYADALQKSILFYEGQRSGKLDANTQRNNWRNDSGLTDGFSQGVNLVGGYYDAGDNVKFGFPMAFTITTLSWSAFEYGGQIKKLGQLTYLMQAIRWGTDYLIKAHSSPYILWGQVGPGSPDHACWERPEDMDTPRTAFAITKTAPGSDLAGETAAAFAAAFLVFQKSDPSYAQELLSHAKQLFKFADTYRGTYVDAITDAKSFYNSYSGYNDELVWAAVWLYRATRDPYYLYYLINNDSTFQASSSSFLYFSWDNKIPGSQVILSKILLAGAYNTTDSTVRNFLSKFKTQADSYLCQVLPDSPLRTVSYTPEGLFYFGPPATQYALNAAFLASVYSDYLKKYNIFLTCGSQLYTAERIFQFSKRQVDYILGDNNAGQSYMVGFGESYPQHVHHRGASIVSINFNKAKVGCGDGYATWFSNPSPNPNVHVGAIVGGPRSDDTFTDTRTDSTLTEGATYYNSPAVGLLGKLATS